MCRQGYRCANVRLAMDGWRTRPSAVCTVDPPSSACHIDPALTSSFDHELQICIHTSQAGDGVVTYCTVLNRSLSRTSTCATTNSVS